MGICTAYLPTTTDGVSDRCVLPTGHFGPCTKDDRLEVRLASILARFLTFTNDPAQMSKIGWEHSYDLKKEGYEILAEYGKRHP